MTRRKWYTIIYTHITTSTKKPFTGDTSSLVYINIFFSQCFKFTKFWTILPTTNLLDRYLNLYLASGGNLLLLCLHGFLLVLLFRLVWLINQEMQSYTKKRPTDNMVITENTAISVITDILKILPALVYIKAIVYSYVYS